MGVTYARVGGWGGGANVALCVRLVAMPLQWVMRTVEWLPTLAARVCFTRAEDFPQGCCQILYDYTQIGTAPSNSQPVLWPP